MTSSLIIGVDPGITSGLFVIGAGNEIMTAAELDFEQINVHVESLVVWPLRTAIGVERFVISERTLRTKREGQWSIEVTGCMRRIALLRGCRFYDKGDASTTKKFASDYLLNGLGWYHPTKGGHINDAARVAALTLAATDPPRWKHLVLTSGVLREERQ